MSTNPVTAFAELTDTVAHLVEAVEEQQWSAPTPCADWNVKQLVGHLVAGQRAFIGVMGAEPPQPALDADPTPEALKDAFRMSAAALVAAFEAPGALERTVQAPIGEVPGAVALHLQTLEHLVHGWDLARATGRKALFDAATVEREIEFARGIVAQAPSGPDAPFAPSRTVPEDAPALDRLAALLGRDTTRSWTAHPGTPRGAGKKKLTIALATTALVVAAATGTALAVNSSSSEASSEQPRTEQIKQETRSPIAVGGPNVFPHSLDFDPRTNTFFAGSLAQGKVFAFGPDGQVRTHIDDPAVVSPQAVRVDRERNRLLVSNVDYGTAERSRVDDPFGIAGVGSYDLETGKQHWCVDLTLVADDDKQHLISDVTVAPDGTAYAVDELSPTVFRIDPDGNASVFLRSDLLQGTLDIPGFLNDVGMSAVEWVQGNQLIITMADGSLVRVPVEHPEQARPVKLSAPLAPPTAGARLLEDGSMVAVSSGLLSGKPAQIQHVVPSAGWESATVTVVDTVEDPVTSDVTAGPEGATYALSGGLAALLAGQPNNGFTLTPVNIG